MLSAVPTHAVGGRVPVHYRSIDGLRAIAVAVVCVGHVLVGRATTPLLRTVATTSLGDGELGVTIFFVISGFLITTLLLRERDASGRIDFVAFFARRIRRIFPAYYTFLFVATGLAACGVLAIPATSLLLAATFTENYALGDLGWYTGHTWSLCVEEQFYLLWPLAVARLGRRELTALAAAIVALAPVLRILLYVALPGARHLLDVMLPTRIDSLMCGALAALALARPTLVARIDAALGRGAPVVALVTLLVLSPLATARFHGAYLLTVGFGVEGLAAATLLLWCIRAPAGAPAQIVLRSPTLRIVGLASFSVYLYQQLFFAPPPPAAFQRFPIDVLGVLAAAFLSYALVERPFLSRRQRVERGEETPQAIAAR